MPACMNGCAKAMHAEVSVILSVAQLTEHSL